MAEGLFISVNTLKKKSIIDGSVDSDMIEQFIFLAQDIHIQNYLGTKLYERLQAGVVADNLNANEIILVDNYIAPALIHYSMAEYLPLAAYKVAQGGVYKHTSESAFQTPKTEVDRLITLEKSYAEKYAQMLVDYLRYNQSLFPEYITNVNEDINPSQAVLNTLGWKISGDVAPKKKRQ